MAPHHLAHRAPPARERGSQLGRDGSKVGAGQAAGGGIEGAIGVFGGPAVLVREGGVAGEGPGAESQDFTGEGQAEGVQLVAHRRHALCHLLLQAGHAPGHGVGEDGQGEEGHHHQPQRNPRLPGGARSIALAARRQPTCTVSIETDPPSIPSTGKRTGSPSRRAPRT